MASTSTMESSRTENLQAIKKNLFQNVMAGKWDEVVNMYGKYRSAHKIKIDSAGQTALHLAIGQPGLHNNDDVVEKLLQHIKRDSDPFDVLKLQNEKGQTPLHLAATSLNKNLCKLCIDSVADVEKASELVRVRDNKKRTPLFKAVHCGRLDTFLYLHSILGDTGTDLSFCERDNGRSILHDAIIKGYFKLAFHIIHWYKDLVHHVDHQEESPLHALAKNAKAFPRGSTVLRESSIIYDCVSVEKPNPPDPCSKLVPKQQVKNEADSNYVEKINVEFVNRREYVEKECRNIDIESEEVSNIAWENQPFIWSRITSRFMDLYKASILKMAIIFGYGEKEVSKISAEKENHVWAVQVLNELVERSDVDDMNRTVRRPNKQQKVEEKHLQGDQVSNQRQQSEISDESSDEDSIENAATNAVAGAKKETAILIAAKYGIVEMVEKIIESFPLAIYHRDKDDKTVLLVAVENRHLDIYKLLVKKYKSASVIFQKVDKKGNTALHLAATYGENARPWLVPGGALQMQREIEWFEYVKNSLPKDLFLQTNTKGETAREVFSSTHKPLIEAGVQWVRSMAESCSVVATLIVTIAFTSIAVVPGGTESNTGKPTLRYHPTFQLYAIASLIALCSSVTSMITFLTLLTSRHQEIDFSKNLPWKILLGVASLFVSVATMLVTFCAGHFLVFEDNKFKYAAFPIYAATFSPLCFYAAAYLDIFRATFWGPF